MEKKISDRSRELIFHGFFITNNNYFVLSAVIVVVLNC